ncbi:MAG: hypothetical protein DI626_09790 [Micavibrio aeruginosavorus]|uniref:Uncharacterized protein n=1 Tax=Micavibrio aeruginosavorus TaxID=349221 RepID=A0A2W5BN59_9BACT|nr:MAG: hypothetical protein DI626_09790 [Micavibrio aeruginosavorus]
MAKNKGIIVGGVVGAGLLVAAAGAFFAVQGDETKEQPKPTAPTALLAKPEVLKAACTAAAGTGLTGIADRQADIANCIERGVPEVKQANNISVVCANFSAAIVKSAPQPKEKAVSAVLLKDDPNVQLGKDAGFACTAANTASSSFSIMRIKP